MTRPRPTPRPRPKPKATDPKPGGDTGDKPAAEVTHLGHRMRRSVNPIGFDAATACQSGTGLVSAPEGDDVA
ncbi:MAG: hypothetical protein JWO11_3556 [Nocardioides sp.]|nr:hypothetical protein [Nocardioides sp.]